MNIICEIVKSCLSQESQGNAIKRSLARLYKLSIKLPPLAQESNYILYKFILEIVILNPSCPISQ